MHRRNQTENVIAANMSIPDTACSTVQSSDGKMSDAEKYDNSL